MSQSKTEAVSEMINSIREANDHIASIVEMMHPGGGQSASGTAIIECIGDDHIAVMVTHGKTNREAAVALRERIALCSSMSMTPFEAQTLDRERLRLDFSVTKMGEVAMAVLARFGPQDTPVIRFAYPQNPE